MEKPKKPIEPQLKHYPRDNKPVSENSPYVRDYHKYQKDMIQYNKDFELYEQTKFIQLIKNADIKYILKKYKIFKIK